MHHLVFALILILAAAETVYADRYFHGGAGFNCGAGASKLTINSAQKHIGSYETYYGFQIFKSKDQYDQRMVSFSAGSLGEVKKLFEWEHIPNEYAHENWSIKENKKATSAKFTIPDTGFLIPLEFKLKDKMPELRFFIDAKGEDPKIDLHVARKILIFLGDKGTPNFDADPPVMTQEIRDSRFSARTNGVLFPPTGYKLRLDFSRKRPYSGFSIAIQIHYPADKYEGLSYHLGIACGPLRQIH